MSRQDDLKRLILRHTRRLQKLKEQQAVAGGLSVKNTFIICGLRLAPSVKPVAAISKPLIISNF